MMKTRIDVIASEESFRNLSTFAEIEEMNKTVRIYRDVIKTSIKRADVQKRLIALLEILKRHSCKYVGVSFLCKNTIAEKLEVSYKTVQRLVKKLEELGMIKQIPMKRKKDMLQTGNAIIIVPAEDMTDKTPAKKSDKCPTNKTNTISLKQKIKRLNKRNSNGFEKKLNKSAFKQADFLPHWIPDAFKDLTTCFYSDSKTIIELWKVVKQNNKVVNHETGQRAFTKDQELNIAMQAFKEFVMKIKQNRRIKNIFGYFNGIVDNLMDKWFFEL